MILCFILLFRQISLDAQQPSVMDKIVRYTGTDDPQELELEVVEKLEHFIDNPVQINVLSESELRSCGLFTHYQVAVISEYISRHGVIRSLSELSLLDGFGEEFSSKVAPFITLVAYPDTSGKITHEISSRSGMRKYWDEDWEGSYGFKYRIDASGKFSGTVAASRSYGYETWLPSAMTLSLAWKLRRIPLRIVAGDFNARFGQGLVLWNNSFLSGLAAPDNFMKKPSGITQSWSFTGSSSLTGIAADFVSGKFQISAVSAFSNLKTSLNSPEKLQFMPALNVGWYGRYGQVSMTNVAYISIYDKSFACKTGIDAAFCIKGVNIFGEAAYDWHIHCPSLLVGSRFKPSENLDMALLAQSDFISQYDAACSILLGVPSSRITCSLEATYYPVSKEVSTPCSIQLKSQLSCEFDLASNWKLKLRLSERIRNWGFNFRTDARADIVYHINRTQVSARLNVLNCDLTSFLSYLEYGYVGDALKVYLRQGLFFVDDWDDRIYVYERDAPGSFNSPAMYGRGVWTSIYTNLSLSRSLRLYIRASVIDYPFMQKKKPGKAELKLQIQYSF